MRKYVFLWLIVLVCGGIAAQRLSAQQAAGGQQQPEVTFATEVNFVEVHAIVTDESGAFVRDLTLEDFEIYEDGKLQDPALFSLIELPIERPVTVAGAGGPVDWDVRAATRNFEGRIYVIVLDDLHTMFPRSQLVKDAARQFIEQYFGENDVAAVVYTSGRQEAGQELTSNRSLLLAAIDRFQGRKIPSANQERLAVHLREAANDEAMRDDTEPFQLRTPEGLQRAQAVRDPLDPERALNARRALSAVENVSNWLSDVQGRRKALLFFSEGIDYDIYQPFNRGVGDSLLLDAQQAVAAAQRANVNVYGIDPRGLSNFGELIDINARSDYPQLDYGNFRGALRELLLSQESLISLAEETGGLAIVSTNDVAGGLGRIVLDNSRYYLLGYYSDSTQWGRRFLRIDVRVKRPGLQVRARRGFMPPDQRAAARAREAEVQAGTSPALAAAISKPLPIGELPLRVFAAPFKGSGRDASVVVAVEIDGEGLTFEQQDGRFNQTLELSLVATDARARVQGGDRQTFELKLLPETYEWISRTGVRLLSRLDLPPSRYQIRVGAHATGGGAVAMVPYDLDVPDYSRIPFALSGIVLTSSHAESFATANQDAELQGVLPGPPVATRRFSPGETLISFVELYDTSSRARREVDFIATVQDASDGRKVFESRDRAQIESSDRLGTFGFRTDIPLSGFAPGVYVLRVEASSRLNGESAYREVPFEVSGASGQARQ